MDDEELNDLNDELQEFADRYASVPGQDAYQADVIQSLTWNEPGEAAAMLIGSYVVGSWDLNEEDLARLWLIGRAMGYTREELLPDSVLARGVSDRGVRPPDPPGHFVQTPVLPGGGHGPGRTGAGKRTFPATWSDDDSIRHTMDVARHPSGAEELPSGDFRAWGERDGVQLSVVVSPQGAVLTSYPVEGAGVVQNPLNSEQEPLVQRLQALVEHADGEPRALLDELLAVGEWPYVITSLRALPLDDGQRADLDELARLTGVGT